MSAAIRARSLGSIAAFAVGMFTKNIFAKLGALVLAVLVWITVSQDIMESYTVNQAVLAPLLVDEDLMIVKSPPTYASVVFRGPIAQMRDLKREEEEGRIQVGLRVEKKDLAGQKQVTLNFSVSRGNLSHVYGTEVQIIEVEPAEFLLTVALRKEATLTVDRPRVEFVPKSWEAEIDSYTQEVRVSGPVTEIEKLEGRSIEAAPIDAAPLLAGRMDEAEPWVIRTLSLARRHADSHISVSLADGEKFDCKIVFRRTRVTMDIQIPIVIYAEMSGLEEPAPKPSDPRVTIYFIEAEPLVQGLKGFFVNLNFEGSESALNLFKGQVADGNVRAYVRAEDLDKYRAREEGQDSFDPAHLFMEGLPAGIRFAPPEGRLQVDVKKR